MRRPPGLNSRRAVLAGLLAVVMSMGATAAWAYWLTSGVGSGSATTGSLAAPTNPTTTYASGASSVSVSWTASAGSPTPSGYFVTRIRTSDNVTSAACGTSAGALTTATSCTDLAVPNGTYRYSVTAVYRSWTATSVQSNAVTVAVVVATATTTTLSSSSNPSVVGQTVTYTAAVTPSGSTGTVTFKDGAATIACTGGNQTLSAGGQATCSFTYGGVASPSVTAVYNGDATHLTSTSAALSQTVNKASTATTLVVNPTFSVTGQSVTLTATVTVNSPGTGTPAGTVTFSNGATVLCSAVALTGPTATCTTAALPVGGKTLTAVYSGSTTLVTSTGTTTQTTTAASTTTVLTTSAANVATGVSVTYTASVSAVAPGSGIPTGTVAFRDNGATITCIGGAQTLNAAGTATCQVSYPATGTHPMTAVFTPAATDYLTSTSAAVTQKVSVATGIVFSNLTASVGASATCSGAGTPNYPCPSSGSNAPNTSTYTAQVSFVDSTGTPVVLSGATQTLNVVYTGKFSGAAAILIPGGAATSTASLSGVMVGNNGGTMVVSTSSAPTWKATLVVN